MQRSAGVAVVVSLLSLSVVWAQGRPAPQLAPSFQPVPPLALPAGVPALSAEQQARMDHDLLEIDIPALHALYARHKYTVTEVTRWYMSRIARYDGIYRDVQTVDVAGALATAKREDAEAASQHELERGILWGVPMVIKANTAVKGLPDTDGWKGFVIPGHELIAPRDATVVARLKAAGAVILGITNMPDFAASDTNRSTAFGRTGNAYDVRFSPGGSSGGTVTAVTSNEAMVGTGTDTGNSIRMPAGTSSVVGVLPTRGLTSIAGIAPLDWLRDNTGPIARNVTDAAIVLGVMAGEDPLDFRTAGSAAKIAAADQTGPYTKYLKKDALKGKRFGVPAFIFAANGAEASAPSGASGSASRDARGRNNAMQPETRAMFLKALDELRAAGATVVIDDTLLPASFEQMLRKINTAPYRKDGADQWLAEFGSAQYHTDAEYLAATGQPLPPVFTAARPAANPEAGRAAEGRGAASQRQPPAQVVLKGDPNAQANFFAPQQTALAVLEATFDRFRLDGLVYPSAQMPPPDETMPQDGQISGGPHSATGWVNSVGTPAIVVPAGFYPSGLPFGLELQARRWHDGDLLGYAYAFEQATKLRRPPVLVQSGLLPIAR